MPSRAVTCEAARNKRPPGVNDLESPSEANMDG